MNNEQAIQLLNNLRKSAVMRDGDVVALEMGMKALEHYPSSDTVSRGVFEQVMWERDVAIEQLKELGYGLGEKPKTYWILISERLPEDEQEILFSTRTGRVHSGKYHDDNSVNQWYSHRDKCRAWNNVVNAWMPLPEPYKVEQQESEGQS